MFRRRRREQPEQVAEQPQAAPSRESGPWDADEPHPDTDRTDLGGLRLPHNPDFDVRLASVGAQHVGVVVLYGESTMQLQAVAAPRSSGLWDEIKTKMIGQLAQLREQDGPFGSELIGEMPTEGGTRSARYIGIDGPRWCLIAVLAGPAAKDESVAAPFLDMLKDTVVVRGDEPMAREESIPLRRPNEQQDDHPDDRSGLNPFRRGPEISELR